MNIGKDMGNGLIDQSIIPEEHKVYAYTLPEEIWDSNTDLFGNPVPSDIWTFLLKCPHCGSLKIGRSTGFWLNRTSCNKCNKNYGVYPDVKTLKCDEK